MTCSDADLVRGFEDATLAEFPHADHVHVAWYYVTHEPLLVAVARMREGLQRFAAAKGKPDRYHETITVAFVLLVADRWREAEAWEAFAARNLDLLEWPCRALTQLYPADVLASPRAREAFVAPAGSAPLDSSAP